jgi:hypothetical protein
MIYKSMLIEKDRAKVKGPCRDLETSGLSITKNLKGAITIALREILGLRQQKSELIKHFREERSTEATNQLLDKGDQMSLA